MSSGRIRKISGGAWAATPTSSSCSRASRTSSEFIVDDLEAPRTGAWNMAVDQALLERVAHDHMPVLRLYRWAPACLSFGRHQPAAGLYNPDIARSLNIDIVRRPTGGMAVLHDAEITYAFVAPAALLGGPRASYLAINRALVTGLRKVGVPAQLSDGARRSAFGTVHPCFAEPAAGEVVAAGMKLVGSAQRCENRTILQHGSILLDGNQDAVARIANVPFDLTGRATTLKDLLGELPPLTALAEALKEGFEEVCSLTLARAATSEDIAARANELTAFYASPDWTWRR